MFIGKGVVDVRSVCAALPGLPAPVAVPSFGSDVDANFGSFFYDMDGPLLAPASAGELEFTSTAVGALSTAVAADGAPPLAQAVPLLVWLMRLIVEPRVTPADGHLCGLLGLARVIVRWLGPQGKEAVGLRGLEGLVVSRSDGDEGCGRSKGLLYHVYHNCLFDIATHENHGPLAPPKCR